MQLDRLFLLHIRVEQYRHLIIWDFWQIRPGCLKLLACCKSVMFNSSYYRLKPCSCQNYTILSSFYTQNSRDTRDDITWYRFSSAGGRDQKRQNWPKGMSASSEQFYSWSHWEKPGNIASVWKVCCFQLSVFPSLPQILLAFQLWVVYDHSEYLPNLSLLYHVCLSPGGVDTVSLQFCYVLHFLLG